MKKVLYLFGQLNDDDIEWLMQQGEVQRVAPQTILIQERKAIDSLYIILEGSLSIEVSARDNERIAQLHAGDIVGEMSFVDARPPSATVKALEKTTVLRVARHALHDKIDEDPYFAMRFYKALAIFIANRLRETQQTSSYLAGDSLDDDIDYDDELDAFVLDHIHLAGSRFDRMLKHLLRK